MTHLDHDGLRFRVEVEGKEGAPWMVFSNSLVTDLSVWDHQVAAFGGRYRIMRYDQRGHGGTDVPPNAATIAQMAEDVAALMNKVGANDAVFAGVSMGAATGICVAQRWPELVSALVVSDGQASTAPGGAEAWAGRIAVALRDGMPGYADATMKRWFSAKSQAEGSKSMGSVRLMIERTPLQGFIACARALQGYDFRAGLDRMRQPALMVAGAEDGAMPAGLRAMAAEVPDGRFVEIADAGHLPCIERPEAFNKAMADFLA